METRTIGTLTFKCHNKRECVFFKEIEFQVSHIIRLLTDPEKYWGESNYTETDKKMIMDYKIAFLSGHLHSAYYIDMLDDSIFLSGELSFRDLFM